MSNSIESRSRRIILAVVAWIVLLAGGTAIYLFALKPLFKEKLEEETGSMSQYQHEIKLRSDSFSGYCILRSSEMKNNLGREGIKLVIEDDQADYVDRIKALRDGKADMAVFTVDSDLIAGVKIGGFPATIVMIIDETKGADAIVAYKSAVENIQKLDNVNARFVLTPSSPSEFLARIVVSDFSLPNLPERWIVEVDGASEVYRKFRRASKDELRAYVLWEPYVSKALEDPDVHILLGSDQLKGYIVDVLVARRKFLKEHADLVKAVVKSYLSAAYAYRDNMVDLVIEDARSTGERLKKEDAEKLVKGIRWKNTLENYAHFRLLSRQETKGLEGLEDIITKITNVLVTTGAFARGAINIQPNALFYDGIIAELQKENFHPGQKVGLIQTTAKLDAVRGDVGLLPLSDEQWEKLASVGEMRIKSLSFRRGTAELNIQSKRDLQDLATRLKSMPQYYLLVVGHSRTEGDMEANRLLAKNRANVAAEYVILRLGVSRNRIRAIAEEPSDEGGAAQSVTFQLGQLPY